MKVTVGKLNKRRVKQLLILLFIFLFLFLLPFIYLLFYILNETSLLIALFFIIVLVFIIGIIVVPGLIYMDFIWEVDERYFKFMTFEKSLDKAKLLYSRFLKNKNIQYQMSLKMTQIDFIQVTYYNYPFYPSRYLYRGSGYKVVFKFYMLDGSQYLFENFVGSDKEGFLSGIQFMQNYGIHFVDQYKILDAYKDNKDIQLYLASVEKEKEHD